MRSPIRTIAVAVAAIILLTGCSVSYPFQLLLNVKDAESGQPLEGVTGVFHTTDHEEKKADFDSGPPLGTKTSAGGGLMHDFQIIEKPDRYRHWYLKLQKDGYESIVIDIRPEPVPKRRERTTVPVAVKMKPLPKQPIEK